MPNRDSPASRELERRLGILKTLRGNPAFAPILADLGLGGAAAEQAAGAAAEIVRWLFAPTQYEQFRKDKSPDRADEVELPAGEPQANAPEVTARITAVECLRPGWLRVTVRVEGSAGADNDDITELRLRLPSRDCNGYRDRQRHRFADEAELQSHSFSVDIKCSDLVSRSDTGTDLFLWVELMVTDDDGNSRTAFMKLASPELDEVAARCCGRTVSAPPPTEPAEPGAAEPPEPAAQTPDRFGLRRVIPGALGVVRSALLDADQVLRWTSLYGGCAPLEIAVDARVDGCYSVHRGAGDARAEVLGGSFLEVDPERVVAVFRLPGMRGRLPRVELRFAEHDGGTEILLSVEGLQSPAAYRHTRRAWRRILEMLDHGVRTLHGPRGETRC